MTSSDVLDTGFALQLRGQHRRGARRPRDIARRSSSGGRSSSATPSAWGARTGSTPSRRRSGTSSRCSRSSWTATATRLRRAREAVGVGAISGVVGSYASVDPEVEQLVCERLGLRPAEASTQVIQRDRHAELLTALAVCASTLDALATEIRHLARTEVREVQEPFAAGSEGVQRHAAQAEPGRVRARERPGARDPRPRGHRAGERGAVARARHLALLGRAHDLPRCDGVARLHAARHGVGDGRARRVPRADARAGRQPRRDRVQPDGAARARSKRGSRATRPTGSSSARRRPRGTRTRASARRSRPTRR